PGELAGLGIELAETPRLVGRLSEICEQPVPIVEEATPESWRMEQSRARGEVPHGAAGRTGNGQPLEVRRHRGGVEPSERRARQCDRGDGAAVFQAAQRELARDALRDVHVV